MSCGDAECPCQGMERIDCCGCHQPLGLVLDGTSTAMLCGSCIEGAINYAEKHGYPADAAVRSLPKFIRDSTPVREPLH